MALSWCISAQADRKLNSRSREGGQVSGLLGSGRCAAGREMHSLQCRGNRREACASERNPGEGGEALEGRVVGSRTRKGRGRGADYIGSFLAADGNRTLPADASTLQTQNRRRGEAATNTKPPPLGPSPCCLQRPPCAACAPSAAASPSPPRLLLPPFACRSKTSETMPHQLPGDQDLRTRSWQRSAVGASNPALPDRARFEPHLGESAGKGLSFLSPDIRAAGNLTPLDCAAGGLRFPAGRATRGEWTARQQGLTAGDRPKRRPDAASPRPLGAGQQRPVGGG